MLAVQMLPRLLRGRTQESFELTAGTPQKHREQTGHQPTHRLSPLYT